MTTILDRFLELARKELGVSESPGPDANKRILEFLNSTSIKTNSDEVPWCSAFVNYIVEEAGLKGTDSAAARSWLQWGKETKKPYPGCIAVLKRGNNPAQGHVLFFSSHTRFIMSGLGGNQHDRVCYANFPDIDVLSYRVPLEWNPPY